FFPEEDAARFWGGFKEFGVFFLQLFEASSCTYTYVVADAASGDAVIIDPVLETVPRDLRLIQELGLNLRYAANTHCHADHVTGSGSLRRALGCVSAISRASGACADWLLGEGDEIKFGNFVKFPVAAVTPLTPPPPLSLSAPPPSGCARTLHRSVHERIFTLPESCRLYP
ncbi:persulfide dioxygenase ETHE1, mitochondrial, partial [Malurus melanocephalus]|uniref:persulfide dioxygenase ETHE1, mitochondrial n=1 Tax=Malurus melanocephalus TaxID=175006 RepID=UPI00254978B9